MPAYIWPRPPHQLAVGRCALTFAGNPAPYHSATRRLLSRPGMRGMHSFSFKHEASQPNQLPFKSYYINEKYLYHPHCAQLHSIDSFECEYWNSCLLNPPVSMKRSCKLIPLTIRKNINVHKFLKLSIQILSETVSPRYSLVHLVGTRYLVGSWTM